MSGGLAMLHESSCFLHLTLIPRTALYQNCYLRFDLQSSYHHLFQTPFLDDQLMAAFAAPVQLVDRLDWSHELHSSAFLWWPISPWLLHQASISTLVHFWPFTWGWQRRSQFAPFLARAHPRFPFGISDIVRFSEEILALSYIGYGVSICQPCFAR